MNETEHTMLWSSSNEEGMLVGENRKGMVEEGSQSVVSDHTYRTRESWKEMSLQAINLHM